MKSVKHNMGSPLQAQVALPHPVFKTLTPTKEGTSDQREALTLPGRGVASKFADRLQPMSSLIHFVADDGQQSMYQAQSYHHFATCMADFGSVPRVPAAHPQARLNQEIPSVESTHRLASSCTTTSKSGAISSTSSLRKSCAFLCCKHKCGSFRKK